MELDALALVMLAGFAALGAIRGTLRSGVRLVCWVTGYVGAVVGAPVLEPVVSAAGVGWPVSLVFAGTAIFALVWIAGAWVVRWAERNLDRERHRAGQDGLGGAFFGLLQGGLAVLLVGWLNLWLQAASEAGAELTFAPSEGSKVSQAAGSLAGRGVELALGVGDPGARVAARLAADPAATVRRVQTLTGNPRIVALERDPVFWQHVQAGSLDAALDRWSFVGIAHDETLRKELGDFGLITESATADPDIFREEVRETLEGVGPRLRDLVERPEVAELSNDPAVQAALEEGDTVALLRDPRVQTLLHDLMAPKARTE